MATPINDATHVNWTSSYWTATTTATLYAMTTHVPKHYSYNANSSFNATTTSYNVQPTMLLLLCYCV